MRFHFGTRIGRMFIGASTSGRRESGGGWWILLLPFLLLIWPFKALYKSKLKSPVKYGLMAALALLLIIIVLPAEEPEKSVEPSPSPAFAIEEISTPEPTIEFTPEPTAQPTPEPTPEPVWGYVDADELNMRAEPSRDGELVGTYEYGQSLKILGQSDDWYNVEVNGTTGFMLGEYVGLGTAPEREVEDENDTEIPFVESSGGFVNTEYGGVVYVTEYGTKYHYDKYCAGDKSWEESLENAKKTLDPCGTCVLQ